MHGPRVSLDAAKLYQQAINDVASMLVLASQSAFEVMCAIEDGTIEAPEEIFFGFGECQDRLNKLIQNRATLKASVDTGAEVADRLTSSCATSSARSAGVIPAREVPHGPFASARRDPLGPETRSPAALTSATARPR